MLYGRFGRIVRAISVVYRDSEGHRLFIIIIPALFR